MYKLSRAWLPLSFLVLTSGLTAQSIPGPTSLGQANVGEAPTTNTLTFTGVSGTATFSVTFGTDFTVGAPTCTGTNCTVTVTFNPQCPGLRQAAVSLFT